MDSGYFKGIVTSSLGEVERWEVGKPNHLG